MWFGYLLFIYVFMVIVCGVCVYYVIGKGGYIVLFVVIMFVIVVGYGDNNLFDGVWCMFNVLVGIVIVLLFLFVLLLYVMYLWCYWLVDVLCECVGVYVNFGYISEVLGECSE